MNLYEGQLLNFDLVEIEGQLFIRVYTGAAVHPQEMAAFKEILARRKGKARGAKCARKFRKSERIRELQERGKKARADLRSGVIELQEILSSLCQYSLGLQERLRQRQEGSSE